MNRWLSRFLAVSIIAAAADSVAGQPLPPVNREAAAKEGIRQLAGRYLTLFTDLPSDTVVDELPQVFDQAVPQWRIYFRVRGNETPWPIRGCLMRDKGRFERCGLLPPDLPPFPNGYSQGHRLWLYEQRSDYYRRCLLLHEGTHSFMDTVARRSGPPWFIEGLAELLATHRWQNSRLQLNYFPATRDDVPLWGRIKLIQDAVAEHRAVRLERIFQFGLDRAHLGDQDDRSPGNTERYAWAWATAAFLDGHPQYRQRYRALVAPPDAQGEYSSLTQERFQETFAGDWQELSEQWQLFVVDLDYGYNLERTAIDFTSGKPIGPGETNLKVRADRGWQNSGVQLEGGREYTIRASGRYQLARTPDPWPCEPQGVTIHYHQGRPTGMLLAAVRQDRPAPGSTSSLLRPYAIGRGAKIAPEQTGTLYFRVNESPARLAGNTGEVEVVVGGH